MKLNICLFLIRDDELLEKINETLEKVTNSIKIKEFDSKLVFDEKHLKTKIRSCNEKIKTNFYNNKIPKEDSQCICLSVILIDSLYRKNENYYPQVFLEECKYVLKEKKMRKYITDDIEIYNDSDREDSDEKGSDKENSDKKSLAKKILAKKIKHKM